MREIAELVLDEAIADDTLRAAIYRRLPRERLQVVIEECNQIARPQSDPYYDFLAPQMDHLEQEHLQALNLNTKNRLLSAPLIYQGTLAGTHVRVAEVFRPAIAANAAGLIVAHNHPSGDPQPSPDDIHITRQLVEAGRLLDINVLDHIVIGDGRFVSMRERGIE